MFAVTRIPLGGHNYKVGRLLTSDVVAASGLCVLSVGIECHQSIIALSIDYFWQHPPSNCVQPHGSALQCHGTSLREHIEWGEGLKLEGSMHFLKNMLPVPICSAAHTLGLK